MDKMKDILNELLGKIFLKKPIFFGIDEQKIVLVVSPTLKIFSIYSNSSRLIKKFPFEVKRFLNVEELKNWANENNFEISYSSQSPKMNKILSRLFGTDLMVESKKKEKRLDVVVLEELEKSDLPDSIKEWAKNNPKKFIENLKHVQNLLKK
jgi:hypothetical protein